MSRCDEVRARLSDSVDDGVDEHLRACGACRTYADALDQVRHHVPHLVPGPPDGLAGRIHEDLGLAAPVVAPTPVGRSTRWRRMTRRTPAGVMAAVAGGLLGLLVVVALTSSPSPQAPDDDAAATLEAVGESHAGQGTSFAFDVAGEVEVRLPEAGLTEGRRRLVAELERLGADPDEALAEGAGRVQVDYRAQGETDGRGALRYELRWRTAATTPGQGPPASAAGTLEVLTVDDRTWVRGDTPDWVLVEGSVGFDLRVADAPHHLGEVVATLGSIEEAGTLEPTTLDEVPVRHLRARTEPGLVVDAWIGEADGWLRRLRWIPPPPVDDRHGTTHGEVVVRLRDHGRSRFLGVPDDWRTLEELDAGQRPPFLPAG